MELKSKNFENNTLNLWVLISSIVILLYWVLVTSIDVYQYVLLGVIYELLWLPFLIGLFAIPIIAIILWVKDGFSLRSYNFYALIISACNALYIINLDSF